MTSNHFPVPAWARCTLGLALLTLLAGCVGAPSTGATWSQRPSPEEVRAVLDRVDRPAPAVTEIVVPNRPGPGA